jgi:hypothetical protein
MSSRRYIEKLLSKNNRTPLKPDFMSPRLDPQSLDIYMRTNRIELPSIGVKLENFEPSQKIKKVPKTRYQSVAVRNKDSGIFNNTE